MAGKIEEAIFIPFGGMNQDDSYINPSPDGDGRSAFEGGDYRYALNIRTGSTKGDSLGDAENIKSTLLVSAYKVWDGAAWIDGTRPSGTNSPIGNAEDAQLRCVFLIFHNSNGDHTICQYKSQEKTIYELLRWDLNLIKAYVSLARVGNFLVFTDKRNKPRIIDYTTIQVLKTTLGASFCEYHISFSKWAPVSPAVVWYTAGSTNRYLEKLIVQFSYRYWYVGGFYSAWGPISNSASGMYLNLDVAYFNVHIPGLIYNSEFPNAPENHNNATFYEVVEFIEIAYRGNQLDTWKSFLKHPVDKTVSLFTNKDFTFDGKFSGTPISPEIFGQDYDEVPIQSGCCEVIDNRVMFGNNKDEHEFVDDVDFIENLAIYSSVYEEADYSWWGYQFPGIFTGMPAESGTLVLKNELAQLSFKSRGVYKFSLEFKDETGKKSLTYTTDNWIATIPANTPDAAAMEPYYAVGWNFKSTFFPPDWATSYQILRTNCLNIEYFLFGVVNKFTLLKDDITVTTDQVTNSEETQQVIRDYFDSGTDDFSLSSRLGPQTRKTKVTTTLNDASRIYIDINNWVNAGAQDNPRTKDFPLNKLYYNFQEGDRVCFLGSSVAVSPTDGQKIMYDVPIIEFTGRALIIEKPIGLLWIGLSSSALVTDFIIEVYRPRKQIKKEDLIYFEMGEWYPITNPKAGGRDFLKRDWRWTDIASVTASYYGGHYSYNNLPCYAGDCHVILKKFYYDYANVTRNGIFDTVITPTMNPNKDFTFGVWEKNNGRANTAYENEPITDFNESQIRFGGKYLQDAVFNNINNFRPRDRFVYPQEYGYITEMINTTSYQVESVGSILLVLSSVKSFSVYVNRTTLEDLGGRTQFFLSDKVLGSYNSLMGDNGCINPESISWSGNGNVYWWDQFNGSWIRYGRDGNTDISEAYKMGTWFKEIAAILEPYYEQTIDNRPWVVSEFDQFHKELIVLMWDQQIVSPFRGYTDYRGVIFNERKNQWKFVHNYNARMFARVNNEVIGMYENAMYIHEAGADYGTFYGVKKPSKIEPVFNKNSRQNKIWQNIAEVSSHAWSIERTLSEYIGSRTYQQSSLDLSKLTEKEWTFFSELMNDQNTPLIVDPAMATATGDKLRSKVLRVLLKLDDAVVVRSLLHQIIIGYADSPKNP